MATKHISQKTYDEVVWENMEDLGMTINEAIEDAIAQFKSQGVDLSNIVTDVEATTNGIQHCVVETFKHIKDFLTVNDDFSDVLKQYIITFTRECQKDFAHRCLAEKQGAYDVFRHLCERYSDIFSNLSTVLKALISLTDGQPDIILRADILLLCFLYKKYRSFPEILHSIFLFIKNACTKHEANRQYFVRAGLIPLLIETLLTSDLDEKTIQGSCAVMRALLLDDDVRVPFGNSHEHSKIIVVENDGLKILIERLKEFSHNKGVSSEILSTISHLAVRNEYCQQVAELGGLKLIMCLLCDNMDVQTLVKQIIGALRSLAISDEVNAKIVQADGIPLLIQAARTYQMQAQVCENVLGTLAILALRNADHRDKIMDNEGAQIIIDCMKIHTTDANVQRQACLCIRNLVARAQQYNQVFIDLGAEELLNQVRRQHKACNDESKAALRDLECQVELKELWKGEKGELQH